jgi:DNA polymerase I-like protein with 3'-5' exonuclease and polymerase domains
VKNVVLDVETDGLLDQLTRIHSLVLRDLDTDEVFSCTNDGDPAEYHTIEQGLSLLSEAERVYAHNGIRFDLPAIQKVYPGFTLKGELRDTYVTACFLWAHIADADYDLVRKGRFPSKLVGSHALEAWGYRLGAEKIVYDGGWDEWSRVMQVYCEQDTAVTKMLVEKIQAWGLPQVAMEIEHELAGFLHQMERNGWPFDFAKAVELQGKLAARRQELERALIAHFGTWFAPDGVTNPKRSMKRSGGYEGAPKEQITAGCEYTKIKLVEFNPSSRDHIADRLQRLYGWKPEHYTDSGKPQVDEQTLAGLPYPPTDMLVEYLLIVKRLGQLAEGKQAWLHHMTTDGPEGGTLTGLYHIHGRVKQNHAITHRAAHSNPNIGQVPKVGSPYGAECRELFFTPESLPTGQWVQVGADASGLELRCLSHYMARYDDGAYIKVILEGDVHTTNQHAAGLETRDNAKTFIYAFLYGAGDKKIGTIVNPLASEAARQSAGRKLKNKFLKNTPALAYLVNAVKAKARKEGYLLLPDGRRVYIRSEHAALNSLLQGAGAIICKRWIVEFNRRLTAKYGPQGWNGQWAALGWIHDEVQIACRAEIADDVQRILVESIQHVTEVFGWRCPLDGDAKLGANWKETH